MMAMNFRAVGKNAILPSRWREPVVAFDLE